MYGRGCEALSDARREREAWRQVVGALKAMTKSQLHRHQRATNHFE